MCLSLWLYGWLGKIQWNIVAWKRTFLQPLKIEEISEADYVHAKRACKDFEKRDLGEYHDLYVQSEYI